MKKLGRLSSVTFLLASIANKSFAVSTEETAASSMGDKVPFAVGALLIICVLFIGYKMDKSAENASIKIKKKKTPKKAKAKKSEKQLEKEEAKAYAEENKSDIPYEADENEYYENDNSFDYKSVLNDEDEYEEDDISLFSMNDEQSSSFDDIDDDISYDVGSEEDDEDEGFEEVEEADEMPTDYQPSNGMNFDSTMVFDSNQLDEEENKTEDTLDSRNNIFEQPIEEYEEEAPEEELDYTDAVDIDDKINSLDELDDMEVPQIVKEEEQDAASFMNELNRYKEEAENDSFGGFTTNFSNTEEDAVDVDDDSSESMQTDKLDEMLKEIDDFDEPETATVDEKPFVFDNEPEFEEEPAQEDFEEEPVQEEPVVEEKHVKRYTKKKTNVSKEPDMGFLNQMEENLRKNQEERMKKAGVEAEEEAPKKRGRKPKNQ